MDKEMMLDSVDPAVAEEIDFLLAWIDHLLFTLTQGA